MPSQLGTKPRLEKFNYRNADAASIPCGAPIILALNGTNDGFDCVLPSTATAALVPGLFMGVSIEPTSVIKYDFGSGQAWGFCNFAIVVVNSRTASTNSFSTAQTLNTGVALSIDTVNNCFRTYSLSTGAITVQTGTASTDTIAVNQAGGATPVAVLAQSVASQAGSATTTSDTRLVATQGLKVFLRAM